MGIHLNHIDDSIYENEGLIENLIFAIILLLEAITAAFRAVSQYADTFDSHD